MHSHRVTGIQTDRGRHAIARASHAPGCPRLFPDCQSRYPDRDCQGENEISDHGVNGPHSDTSSVIRKSARRWPDCILRLQKLHDIRELPDGHPVRIMRRPRLTVDADLRDRVMRKLVRRVDDRGHQVSVRDWPAHRAAQDDWDGRFDGRTWQVQTGHDVTGMASERQKSLLASFDVTVRRQAEA